MLRRTLCISLLLMTAVSVASADPTISLSTPAQFQNAITSGNLTGQAGTALSTDANGLVANTAAGTGGYNYTYGPDPNLTTYSIQLDLLANPTINAITIGAVDTTAKKKQWTFAPFPSPLLTNQVFDFPLAAGAGADNATAFFQDPGFNLQNVVQLQVGFQGTPGPNGLTLETSAFIVEAPEPSMSVLLLAGVLSTALPCVRRRWKTARSRNRLETPFSP